MDRSSCAAATLVVALSCASGCSIEEDPGWLGDATTGATSTSGAATSAGSASDPTSSTSGPDDTGSSGGTSSGSSASGSSGSVSGSTGQSSTGGGTAGPDVRTIFTTSTTYSGDLGGISGADGICQATADAASLGGTWKAFLAAAGQSAMDRVGLAGPLQNMQGEVVGVNVADLLDGSIAAPVSYDENGAPTTEDIWTGMDFGGDPNDTCMDWTTIDSNMKGNRGLSDVVNNEWISNGFRFCNSPLHLYCVSD